MSLQFRQPLLHQPAQQQHRLPQPPHLQSSPTNSNSGAHVVRPGLARNGTSRSFHRANSIHSTSPVGRSLNMAKELMSTAPARPSTAEPSAPDVVDQEMGDAVAEDDPVNQMLKQRWTEYDSRISSLFGKDIQPHPAQRRDRDAVPTTERELGSGIPTPPSPSKRKAARTIDDDYGDDDDDDEDEAPALDAHALDKTLPSPQLSRKQTSTSSSSDQNVSSEDVRKRLEQDKKMAEENAKRTFHTTFFTLEADRDAMLEQQKLDELDRQVENEMSTTAAQPGAGANSHVRGSLSTADLGASSLTLKNLIARIDAKRHLVNANDSELRTLIGEVRKGRSKWASEEKVGQEELYEAAEKVLMELKAMTEHSTPFLTRVNKREAPDYFAIIKHPMDIGSMIKKLKSFAYKSKREFVADLNLIWTNCLTYNTDPNHPLRKKALYMRKETDKIVPLIPDIVVRDRAEVEAEERRQQNLDVDLEGGEDSDDDLPVKASRGRKAPSKGKRGATNSVRQSTPVEGTPKLDVKTQLHANATLLRNGAGRAASKTPVDGVLATPPPGPATNGALINGTGHSELMDADSDKSVTSAAQPEDLDEYDADYKTWKQVTKKDRAAAATLRNRLFVADRLNPDEPALLRTKAGMRKWMRQQKQYLVEETPVIPNPDEPEARAETMTTGETLAEGIEKDQESTLPDYYDTQTAIPELADHLKWAEDSEGKVVTQSEQYLRLFPSHQFVSPVSQFTKQMAANMRQMQDTRRVCSKIGVVKQMQVQTQTYQNQFQKYDPEPFLEQDIDAVAVAEDGPIMAPHLCRTALQRSVGKIFYNAGFEDFQPSALDAVTDIATDFFTRLVQTFGEYREAPKSESGSNRFTAEEQVLHCLDENGIDLESLDSYVNEDVKKLGTKLGALHERMKGHLANLLRPALGEGLGKDGVGAFQDGSEQFVGGDFAEDIDEDFFGFRELGLAAEFGLESLSVPLHLLQNRMNRAYQSDSNNASIANGPVYPQPEAPVPLSTDNLAAQIGLVRDFFSTKLAANAGKPLIEDEELPAKQRFPRPRLPPTGKISSPRKRPIREQQQAAKKKRKLEEASKGLGPAIKFPAMPPTKKRKGSLDQEPAEGKDGKKSQDD